MDPETAELAPADAIVNNIRHRLDADPDTRITPTEARSLLAVIDAQERVLDIIIRTA